jgi:hypothetical protein
MQLIDPEYRSTDIDLWHFGRRQPAGLQLCLAIDRSTCTSYSVHVRCDRLHGKLGNAQWRSFLNNAIRIEVRTDYG